MDITKIAEMIKKKVKEVDVNVGGNKDIDFWFPTGVLALDWICSQGKGFPGGRVVEIYGDYSSGKSYLAYKLIGTAQKEGLLAVLIDEEESFSKELAIRAGVNVENLLVVGNVSVEEAFEVVKQVLLGSDGPVLVVWDSLAATPTEHELEGGVETKDLTKASVVGKGLRYTVGDLARTNSLLVFLNQIREKIGVSYGDTIFAPGGRAVGFHASLRVEMRRVRKIVEGEDVVGFEVRAKVVKNRVSPPFKEVSLNLRWDREDLVPWWEGLLEVLMKEGKVEAKVGWYNVVGDEKKWRASEFLVQLVENEEMVRVMDEMFGDRWRRYIPIMVEER